MQTPHSRLMCTACDGRRGYAMGLSVVTRAACEVVIPNSPDKERSMSASFRLSSRALGIALSTAIGLAPLASYAQQRPATTPRAAQPAPAQQPAQAPAGQAGTGPTVVQVKPQPSQTTRTKVCGKDQTANKEIC